MNWAGQPLTSHDVVVNLIAGTTTRTGLTVQAERDHGTYPRGIIARESFSRGSRGCLSSCRACSSPTN